MVFADLAALRVIAGEITDLAGRRAERFGDCSRLLRREHRPRTEVCFAIQACNRRGVTGTPSCDSWHPRGGDLPALQRGEMNLMYQACHHRGGAALQGVLTTRRRWAL